MADWDNAEGWIAEVTRRVRWAAARPTLARELRGHIEDAAAALTTDETSPESATLLAVASMGDAAEVGDQLNAVWQPKKSLLLPLCAAGLTLFGIAAQSLSGSAKSPMDFVVLLAAVGLCFGISRTPLERAVQNGVALYLCYALVAFAAVLFAPTQINGRLCWMIGGAVISLNYLFLFFPPFFALLLARLQGKGLRGILLAGALAVPVLCLPVLMPSVFMALLCTVSGLVLLTGAICSEKMGCSRRAGLGLVWGPTIGVILAVLVSRPAFLPYFGYRLTSFFDPYSDPTGFGYPTLAVRRVLGEAGLFSAASEGTMQLLPAPSSDFLLTAFIGQAGWWVLLGIVGLFVILLVRGALIANRQPTLTGGLLSASVLLALGFQGAFSILGNLGLMPPFSSLPLPFFSSFSTLADAVLLGILLAALRYGDLLADPPALPFASSGKFLELCPDGSLVIRFR